VHIGHLARTLGRPTAWLRRLDDLLEPVVLANGERVYHLERAWIFTAVYDGPDTCLPAFEAYWRDCDEREAALRRKARNQVSARGPAAVVAPRLFDMLG
jgi:hypothetical protein